VCVCVCTERLTECKRTSYLTSCKANSFESVCLCVQRITADSLSFVLFLVEKIVSKSELYWRSAVTFVYFIHFLSVIKSTTWPRFETNWSSEPKRLRVFSLLSLEDGCRSIL
jgi:hypothetical protein